MTFSLEAVQLIAAFVQSVLHGLYLASCVPSVRCLLWNGRSKSPRSPWTINWPLVLATLTIFITTNLSLSLGMYRSIQVVLRATDPNSAPENASNWVNMVKSTCTYTTICAGDGILIYRCWVVYYRRYLVIVFPVLVWIADSAGAIVLLWLQGTVNAESLVNNNQAEPILKAYTALSIPVNMFATSMIVFRIWSIDRENAKFNNSTKQTTLQGVIRIIIESGLLYTAAVIACFVCIFLGTDVFYVGTSIQISTIGIAMNLMLIRAHNQASIEEFTMPSTITGVAFCTRDTQDGTMSNPDMVQQEQRPVDEKHRMMESA
ncbi:hypothetical protein C8J56DRAFT_1165133 [Mycena floridula]|nr:hypothetical protein C8J56DRAFT_1165133 [Mycena floridula]